MEQWCTYVTKNSKHFFLLWCFDKPSPASVMHYVCLSDMPNHHRFTAPPQPIPFTKRLRLFVATVVLVAAFMWRALIFNLLHPRSHLYPTLNGSFGWFKPASVSLCPFCYFNQSLQKVYGFCVPFHRVGITCLNVRIHEDSFT